MNGNPRRKYIIILFISREIILIAMKHERSCGSRRVSKFCACAMKFVSFARNDETTDRKWMQRLVRSPMSSMRNRTPTGNLIVYLIFPSRSLTKKNLRWCGQSNKKRRSTCEENGRDGWRFERVAARASIPAPLHTLSHVPSEHCSFLLKYRAYIRMQRVCP